MLREFAQRQMNRRPGTLAIVILLAILVFVLVFWAKSRYDLNLARELVAIPDDVNNLSAFYLGIGQGRTLYARFDLIAGSEDRFLAELCEQRYTAIDSSTNLFKDVKPEWWMPYWWRPPSDPQTFLGGECYDRTIYHILIDMTNESTYTAYIIVGL